MRNDFGKNCRKNSKAVAVGVVVVVVVSYRIVSMLKTQAVKPLSLHLCETLQYNKILINSNTHTLLFPVPVISHLKL